MTDQKRACLFCGATPVTKEHNPPQWTGEFFPEILGATATSTTPDGTSFRGASRSHMFAKVGAVCGSCNNGWMSKLEVATKPILGPMIQGRATKFTTSKQIKLATWLAKTALVSSAQRTWTQDLDFEPAFKEFYETQLPSVDTYRIFIGTHGSWHSACSMHFHPYHEDGIEYQGIRDYFQYTILLGHFVGVVIYRDKLLGGLFPSFGPRLTTIWPARDWFMWPADRYFTTDEVRDEIAHGPPALR